MIAIGQLTAPQGLRGQMRLYMLTDFPERIQPGLQVFVENPPASGQGSWTRIQSVRHHRGAVLVVALDGVTSREQAEALRSALVKVRRQDRYRLPADTFYVDDLVGLPVYTKADGLIGHVSRVHSGPANDVYEVTAGQRTALIPAVKRFVAVDLAAGRIVVAPIPGMIDELLEGTAE